MQANTSDLKQVVDEVIRKSKIGKRIKNVVLEADQDDEGSSYLTATLEVGPLDDVKDSEIGDLVESIEKAIGNLDERFLTIHFADAA